MREIWTPDKYHPIPGEMDTIDCVRKERDELKSLLQEREKEIAHHKRQHANAENEVNIQAKRIATLEAALKKIAETPAWAAGNSPLEARKVLEAACSEAGEDHGSN